MGAFEFGNNVSRARGDDAEFRNNATHAHATDVESVQDSLDSRRLREECIIALKVYDQCRQPDCI